MEVDENRLLDGVSKRKLIQESSFCSPVAGKAAELRGRNVW